MSQATPTDSAIAPDLVDEHRSMSGLQEAILMLFCAYDTRPDKREIADRLGLAYSTVARVCATKEFKAAYQEICKAISHDRMKEVLDRNAALAALGDPKHTAVYLKMHGLLYDKTSEQKPEPEKVMNSEELEARKAQIMKQMKDEARKEVESEMKSRAITTNFTEVKSE